MALHDVRTPDGQILKINAPDDASEEDILGFAQSQYKPLSGQKRSWTEAATDVGGSFISGVGSLLQLPGQVGQLAGITEPEEKPTGLQGVGKQVEEFGQELKSPVLKGKETLRSQKIAAAAGEGTVMDVAKQAGVAFLETIKDPALITSFFAEQVPNLFGSMGGGLLARGGVKLLMRNAADDVIGKAGVAGAVGTGAVMQGADVGADTYEAIYKRLAKDQPDMPVEERNRIALAQGRQAALQAAGISLATAALPGGRSIERALAGKGAPGVGGFTRGFFGESGSESGGESSGESSGESGKSSSTTKHKEKKLCKLLDKILISYNKNNNNTTDKNIATHIALGHTPQFNDGIGMNAICNNRVWRCDVGMSKAFGDNTNDNNRKPQVLEILNGTTTNVLS
jgi:hypothetical protein